MHLLRNLRLDSDSKLARHFMPHQVAWIQGEKLIHRQNKQVVALAEKSVRIGWTYADAFKNVRKRLWFKGRDYLFATKDYPSALEYVRQCYKFADIFNLTRAIVSHGEENLSLSRMDEQGRPSAFTEEVKIGVIKFDNGSRIIAFSANPQAMSVYGGDVGLDEFAKHPNARLLWETAQARVTWNYDPAIWSSHDGEDTPFNEFAQEARAAVKAGQAHAPLGVVAAGVSPAVEPGIMPGGFLSSSSAALPYQPTASRAARTPPSTSGETPDATLNTCERENLGQSVGAEGRGEVAVPPSIANQTSKIENPHSPWNLYFRITLPDAIGFGLVDAINQARGTNISPQQFLGD